MRSNTVEVANVAGYSARTNNDRFNGPMDTASATTSHLNVSFLFLSDYGILLFNRVPCVTTKRYCSFTML